MSIQTYADWMCQLRQPWKGVLTLAGAASLLLVQSATLTAVQRSELPWVPSASKSQTQPKSPELARALSLGHTASWVDWLLIKFLTDGESHKVPRGERAPVYWDLLLASDLDPGFFEIYYFGANVLTIIRDDNEGAKILLDRGEKFRTRELPKLGAEFRSRFWQGEIGFLITRTYVEIFEMDNLPAGVEAFREIAKLPNPPEHVLRLVSRADTPEGQIGIGIQLIKFLIESQGKEPAEREKLQARLRSLQVIQHLYGLNQAFQEYLKGIPAYRAEPHLSPQQMRAYFDRFAKTQRRNPHDPFVGNLRLDPATGKITTSTPHQKTLGLFY